MKIRQMTVLLVALVGISACDLGYTIQPGVTGVQRSVTFYVPDNPGLAFRVGSILNDINRNTYMSHSVVQSAAPGPWIGTATIVEVPDAAAQCGGPNAIGCAITRVDGGYASGGDAWVQNYGGSDTYNNTIAHEIGHLLGLDHHDSVIRDSSGNMTSQLMCSGTDFAGDCAYVDLWIAVTSDFYAEGDLRGLQYLSSHGR